MTKDSYDQLVQQEITAAVDRLMPYGGGAIVTEVRMRAALDVLVQRVASHTKAYELLGIRTTRDLAELWNVSERRAQVFVANLHARHDVGRKIGNVWCLSADEALNHRPNPIGGRPKKLAKTAT